MITNDRKDHTIHPLEGYPPQIGAWLWSLQDTRGRTVAAVRDVAPEIFDHTPPSGNSIGTLLYHIAAIEMDWLFMEILEREEFPSEIVAMFPYDVREAQGRLTPVIGISLEEHLNRLERSRHIFLESMRSITIEDFRRPRHLPDYDVTPEWVLYHLTRHEAGHQGQILQLRNVIFTNKS